MKYNHKFLHEKKKVFKVPGDELKPGAYEFSFTLELPHGMPGSIIYKEKDTHEDAKAKVKYWIKATLDCNGDDMKYKQVLAVREKPVSLKTNEQ